MNDAVKAIGGFAAIPIGELRPSPNNPRENLTDIDGLALSLRESGMIQPIVAQKIPGHDGYQIIAGHRRFAAALRLGWARVPVIVRRDMLPDEELLAMLVENGQRAGLDPIEEARALKRLKTQTGLTDVQLAGKVGYSQAKVSGRIALLALPIEEQEELRAGHTTIGNAVEKARVTSGKVRPGAKGKKSPQHFGQTHTLAARAKARCSSLNHKRRGGASVGGVACGLCWEAVIRADERDQLHGLSAEQEKCVLCDAPQPAQEGATA